MLFDKSITLIDKGMVTNSIGEKEPRITEVKTIKGKALPYSDDIRLKEYGIVEGKVLQVFIKEKLTSKDYYLKIDGDYYRVVNYKDFGRHVEILAEKVRLSGTI